ncbi:MAG: aminotransferase class I/II-fold pyridoxal phosphate-dependent enzyme [Janthinobacterium lividum]
MSSASPLIEPDSSESSESSNHGENFALAELFNTDATTLQGRVKPFSDFYRDTVEKGMVHYSREIVSAVSNRTRVRGADGTVREMIMLGSNNYLGLTTHPHVVGRIKDALDAFGAGVGGPPLLGGMTELHRQLEKRLSQMKGAEDTMLFGSGYQANLGWVNTLIRPDDVLLYDAYNHASLYDGIALTAAKTKFSAIRFAHNDMDHLERLLMRYRKAEDRPHRQIFVAAEGVYSMDGDLVPLPRITELCAQYGAVLMVDDAHGTGVMGAHGGGVGEHFGMKEGVDIWVGSFSKAFGMTGGFLSASREVIDYLRFCSRSYIFSAHLPITTVAAVLGGLEVLEKEPERIVRLHENAAYLEKALSGLGFKTFREAAIIPVHMPAEANIREVCKLFDDEGIFLNSIEYPAVSKEGQRLRLSVMATHTREDLDEAIAAFERVGRTAGLLSASR